jgi:RNA polymerase sigma-70 factor (ECF subfamily)
MIFISRLQEELRKRRAGGCKGARTNVKFVLHPIRPGERSVDGEEYLPANMDSITATGTTLGGPPHFVVTGERANVRCPEPPVVGGSPMQQKTETELLERVAAGDVAAFSALYDRLAGVLFALAHRILQNAAATEDVVQEAFMQIWENAAYNPALGRPLTWAITLTRNRAIDRLRSAQRGQRLIEAVTQENAARQDVPAGSDAALLTEEVARDVRAALAQLPVEQRQAIEMAFFAGLSQSEIAAALGTPLGTVKARIRRGMLQLRQSLDGIL